MRASLKENEKILFTTRPHWLTLSVPFALMFFTLTVSLVVYIMAEVSSLILFIPLLFIAFFLYKYFYWKSNVWVVTNLRVIDEQGILSITSIESPLEKINNVSYYQSLLGRMMGYGDVKIQTAAEMGATTFRNIASPKKFQESITSAQEMYKQNQISFQANKFSEIFTSSNSDDTIECPYCAEKIKAKAKLCRFCGRELPKSTLV